MTRRPDARGLVGAAPLFAALGDETRLRLLARLCDDGPMSISRLTAEAGARVTRQAVTKHLRVMRAAGVVRDTKVGREVVWHLEPERLGTAVEHLDRIARRWDEAIERLRVFVESPE